MCEPETEIECAACDSVPIYIYIHYMGKFLFLFFLQNFGTFFFFYPIQEQKHYVRSGSDDLG